MSADSAPETGPAASTAVPKKWRPHLEQAVNAYLQGRDDCTVILTIISKPSRSLQPKVEATCYGKFRDNFGVDEPFCTLITKASQRFYTLGMTIANGESVETPAETYVQPLGRRL